MASLAVRPSMRGQFKVLIQDLFQELEVLLYLLGVIGLIPLISFGFIPLYVVFDLKAEELTWLIVSAGPVFIVGLAEDLGYPMSPRVRLFASAVSSLLAVIFF